MVLHISAGFFFVPSILSKNIYTISSQRKQDENTHNATEEQQSKEGVQEEQEEGSRLTDMVFYQTRAIYIQYQLVLFSSG